MTTRKKEEEIEVQAQGPLGKGFTLAELRAMLKDVRADDQQRVMCQVIDEDDDEQVFDIVDVREDEGVVIIDLDPAEL